ncbi:flagellar protein FlaG [Sulfurimonas sp. C5]|uniref:flagellar protein FlaG n=1 Tax=Sulfurimonas sp. C5 TaxID=3036947 RepID=UPI002458E43E|nr:flagellar protein FlaG [Sulfurimonas sp. C5]MDH4943559.1 flagellar protein FlaG [Sulfurimonas sp. C5]
MDGIANVAKQQQSHVGDFQGRSVEQSQHTQLQQTAAQTSQAQAVKRITSKEDMQELVQELNKAMGPISTNIKFGVDSQDIFYVSVIESETNKMIRRFPADKAQQLLPKMQEVSGVLFDSKG